MELTLSMTQALQLAAIGPCIFLIIYLTVIARPKYLILVPVLYFFSLTCNFLLPVLNAFPEINNTTLHTLSLWNEHLTPTISFLFIAQLLLKRIPPFPYWLIITLPLVGGGYFFHLALINETICIHDTSCIHAENILIIYRIISSAIMYMLLVIWLKNSPSLRKNDSLRTQKYWLITMLIIYHLLVLGIDLAMVASWLTENDVLFTKTMTSITFLYLVTTSIFRVFYQQLGIHHPVKFSSYDQHIIQRIEHIITTEKPYVQLGYHRDDMAATLKITEQHLSRLINQHFGKSFSELMNQYRLNTAKKLLTETDIPITTIAFDCGFSSITSFNRVFKTAENISPSHYRQHSQ